MTKQAERQQRLHELDQRLQRFQREHPVQAWVVAFGIAAVVAALIFLLVHFIQKGTPMKTLGAVAVGIALVMLAARTIFAASVHDLVALFIIGLVVSRTVDLFGSWVLKN